MRAEIREQRDFVAALVELKKQMVLVLRLKQIPLSDIDEVIAMIDLRISVETGKTP